MSLSYRSFLKDNGISSHTCFWLFAEMLDLLTPGPYSPMQGAFVFWHVVRLANQIFRLGELHTHRLTRGYKRPCVLKLNDFMSRGLI